VLFLAIDASANLGLAAAMEEYMRKSKPFTKPVVVIFSAPPGIWDEAVRKLDRKKGLAVLPTPERAARAMRNLWGAHVLFLQPR
jgi:hypothetical protein